MYKKFYNYIRNSIKQAIKDRKDSLVVMEQDLDTIRNGNWAQKQDLIFDLVRKYNIVYPKMLDRNNFKVFGVSKEDLESCFIKEIYVIKHDLEILDFMYKAISKEGIISVIYSLPIFILWCNNVNYYSQYLIIKAIKYNGEHNKDVDIYDELENKLHNYEKEMAKLFDEDLNIDFFDKVKFLKLFSEYMNLYAKENENKFSLKENQTIYDLVNTICDFMQRYIIIHNFFVQSINKEDVKTKVTKEEIIVQKDPLEEYIQNGKVIKLCDIDVFEKLLRESKLSLELQNEYVRQMTNLFGNIYNEKLLQRKNNVLIDILNDSEIDLYNKAKVSNKVEATQIVKDIDAILELLLDVNNEEEKDELVTECKLYISYLKDILEVKVEEYIPKVLYFKVNNEPFILDNIRDIQKGNYKQILADLNKIIDGNIVGDREVLGTKLPIYLWAKGKEYKIFYTVIKGVTIVIACYKKDVAFDKIKSVINSLDFKNYLNSVKILIDNDIRPDEGIYTDLLKEQLSRSGIVRKRVN